MMKYLVLLFLLIGSNLAYAEVDLVVTVPLDGLYEINEPFVDYITSSSLVDVVKKDNKLVVKNIGLGSFSVVNITLIKADGSLKTIQIKEPPNKKVLEASDNNDLSVLATKVKVGTRIHYSKNSSSMNQQKQIKNSLSITKDKSNGFVNVDTYSNSDERQSHGSIESAGVSSNKYKYNYKRSHTIGNSFMNSNLSNFHELQLTEGSLLGEIKMGKVYKNYSVNNYILTYQDEFELYSDYADNKQLDIYNYLVGSRFRYKQMQFELAGDLNLENYNKNEYLNYNRAYLVSTIWNVQNQMDRFTLSQISYTREHYVDNLVNLNGISKEAHSSNMVGINSKLDKVTMMNKYNDYTSAFVKRYSLSNTFQYDHETTSMSYLVNSYYSKSDTIANHTGSIGVQKRVNYWKYFLNTTINMDNIYDFGVSFDDSALSMGFDYRFNQNKTSDRASLFVNYATDLNNYMLVYDRTNTFYGKDTVNNIQAKYGHDFKYFKTDFFVNYAKYENISKANNVYGFNVSFDIEKNVDFSYFFLKKKKIKVCLDTNYDKRCTDNDEVFSKEVVIQSGLEYKKYLIPSSGEIELEFSQRELKSVTSINPDYKIVNSQVSADSDFIVIQYYRNVATKVLDSKTNNKIDGITAFLNCGELSSTIKLKSEDDILVPDLDCSIVISPVNNKIPLEAESSFVVNRDDTSVDLSISPLKRLTLVFYKDQNHNNKMDADEVISMNIDGKRKESPIVIENKKLSDIKIKTHLKCNIPVGENASEFFDKSFIIQCF